MQKSKLYRAISKRAFMEVLNSEGIPTHVSL